MHSRCLGRLSLADDLLRPEIETLLGLPRFPCSDAVGQWTYLPLWEGPRAKERRLTDDVRRDLPYLDRVIAATFHTDLMMNVNLFAAERKGYIRPHRDWTRTGPQFTRIHLPIRTNDRCLNSEDDIVYHMGLGEVWYLDGDRPHSGGCFADATRLHLAIDFIPSAAARDVVRSDAPLVAVDAPQVIERPPLTEAQRSAIAALAAIATEANLPLLLDFLGAVHFERDVPCDAVYAWLLEIARAAGSPALVQQAANLRDVYVGGQSRRQTFGSP